MFAHTIVDFTGPDDVQWSEAAEPAPDGGVVIDVVAAGVSFADLLQTNGAYQMIELRRTGVLHDPPVQAYPFADARGALRAIADRRARGKVVLSRQVHVWPAETD